MSDGSVDFQQDGPVARVVFDRPNARNAMTWSMYQELEAICTRIRDDPTIRVATFRGAGGDAFVAGTDIGQFAAFASGDDGLAYEARMGEILGAVDTLQIPTLAVVEGWCVGGGLAIAASCDLRIATPSARFGVPIARTLGNCLAPGTVARLLAEFGVGRTKRMLLLSEMLTAEEVRESGFVFEVVTPPELEARLVDITARLAGHAPVTIRVTKEEVRRFLAKQVAEGGEDLVRECYGSADFFEGVQAFREKRRGKLERTLMAGSIKSGKPTPSGAGQTPTPLVTAPGRTIHSSWREDQDAVTLIDAHHHLWDLGRNVHPWLGDEPEEHFFLGAYDALKRNYLPEDYLADSQRHNVMATVHCEAEWNRDDQVGETRWISEISKTYGFPNAIVAHAWFHTENSADVLAAQARFPLVRGIRSKPVTTPSPHAIRSAGPGTMRDPRWLAGFARLQEHGLSWDLRVPFWHLDEAAEVARAFPQTPIVLNHTGFPWDRSEEGLAAWRRAMETIAAEPNVYLKVSEFGLRDRPWIFEENRRIVHDAISIFGIERCMFATNFPVAGLRIEFDALVRSVKNMVSDLPVADQDAFFWRNAANFYRLSF